MLDQFKEQLTKWLDEKQWKPNVTNFIRGYIKGLRPRAITRDSNWGLPVPLKGAEGKVLYVWFDAPIGYLSASMEWAHLQGKEDLWEKYWLDETTKLVQFIGKDNIPFHAAIFPAMTMGQNQPYKLVDELPANEFYNLEGRQFSKSEGWSIDLDDFFNQFTTDQIRYTIAANAPETQDSEFTWKDFQMRCNAELLGKYGNLVNRILVFAGKNCDGKIPSCESLEKQDQEFLEKIKAITQEAADAYKSFRVRRASQLIMELAQLGNGYFDAKQPWKDVKNVETVARAKTTVACCLECLKCLALISFPVIPATAEKVWSFLNQEKALKEGLWDEFVDFQLSVGTTLKTPEILFKKIEDEQIAFEMDKLYKRSESEKAGETQSDFSPVKENVEFTDFTKLDLRVGKILEVEVIPKSKKLFKLKVDLGFETRCIVSGIRTYFEKEQLVGKKVVVVANLKPTKIMGVTSEGMVLAGSLEKQLELPEVSSLPPGSVVN